MRELQQRINRLPIILCLLASGLWGATAQAAANTAHGPSPDTCDRACMIQTMNVFLQAMTAHRFATVPVAPDAEVRENAKLIALPDTLWARVKTLHSTLIFADVLTGNVVGRAGVELIDGTPAYISTRLKIIAGGRLADIEIEADSSPNVAKDYVWNLDHTMEQPLPADQRVDRVALDALLHRYFTALATHRPDPADYDDAICNRFHSGHQITHVASNGIEAGSNRTCVSSNQGNPPWGPATEQRVPVIDEERGIVVGIMLLHYLGEPGQPTMYVQEVYKVVGGKIVKIDNIAIKGPRLDTLGFVH